MLRRNLNEVARQFAAHARKNLASVARGAVPLRLVEEPPTLFPQDLSGSVVGVFGNDNYIAEPRSRREVEVMRLHLRGLAAVELGFGLSRDGFTWAMVVHRDDRRYQTKAGKAMQRELLKIAMEETVNLAWTAAEGPAPGQPPLPGVSF